MRQGGDGTKRRTEDHSQGRTRTAREAPHHHGRELPLAPSWTQEVLWTWLVRGGLATLDLNDGSVDGTHQGEQGGDVTVKVEPVSLEQTTVEGTEDEVGTGGTGVLEDDEDDLTHDGTLVGTDTDVHFLGRKERTQALKKAMASWKRLSGMVRMSAEVM